MKWYSETVVSGALSGLLSAAGAVAAATFSKKILFENATVIVLFPLLGAVLGVLAGKFIWSRTRKSPSVVDYKKIKTNKRLPGEVFMGELLQKPIHLRKFDNGLVKISIDRSGVKKLVISNEGRKALSKKYVDHQRKDLEKRDGEIHRFLAGCVDDSFKQVQLDENFRLRWASGGVLSVVKFNGKFWIPLFFRDIRPYGWNIALGSSERHFDKNNRVTNNLEYELNSPSRFIFREFLEETLILREKAERGGNTACCIALPHAGISEDNQRKIQFEAEYRALRKDFDRMEIFINRESYLSAAPINANMLIETGEPPNPENGVLVCFSLLDLGIEVVRVLKYDIPDTCEILDGEILETYDGKKMVKELTRMPVALISCEFLNKVFSRDITKFRYTIATQPSIEIDEKIPPESFHLFEWDVKKRLEIISDQKEDIGFEKQRYTDWYDKFRQNFLTPENKLSKDNPSRLFTPATAKILNLFFKNTPPEFWNSNQGGSEN